MAGHGVGYLMKLRVAIEKYPLKILGTIMHSMIS
jgi:hypothetical protein